MYSALIPRDLVGSVPIGWMMIWTQTWPHTGCC